VLDSATKEIRDEAAAEAKGGADGAGSAAADEPHAEVEEEFDYLGYTQERAMFFWGDAIKMGMVRVEELPEEIRSRVKTVEY
jgi:choline kinase